MYTKGEVVWAKIKGFPWWPGIVAKVIYEDKENPTTVIECLVNFIGENSHAQLTLDKVAKFQQKYNEYAKMKKKKLLESIEIANKIVSGETTYEAESKKLENSDDIFEPLKKKKDSQSTEKSPREDGEHSLNRSESDRTSKEGSELMSPLDKSSKRNKPDEKKELKRKSSFSKQVNGSTSEKSPFLNKNRKNGATGKREHEEDKFSLDDPKPTKVVKMDETREQEALKMDSKMPEELNGKLERQSSKSFNAPSSTNNIFTHMSNMNIVSTATISPRITANSLNTQNAMNTNGNIMTAPKKADLEALHDLIIEKIVNYKSSSVHGLTVEKSIEGVLSRINPETMSIAEILENDLGKNIHTLLILVDELSGLMPKSGMNIESEISKIKDKLLHYIDVIKSRLILHYVENVDYCSQWLKKLEQKKEEKNREEKTKEEKKKEEKKKEINKEEKMVEEKKQNEKKKEINKEKTQEPAKSSQSTKLEQINKKIDTKLEEINQKIEELEENAPVKVEEEGPKLEIDFEGFRYEDKGKKILADKNMKTTSTKISKPIYDTKRNDAKQKENVVNPSLRKKICLKMSKILQEKYNMEKDVAQELTLKVEAKIRHVNPDMQAEYKDKVLVVLKLLKYSLVDIEEFANNFKADFSILRERLDIYQRQNADIQGDDTFGGNSPTLTKDISRETNMMLNKMSELK